MLIALGVITGIIGFLPLYICFRKSKKVDKTSKIGNGLLMIIGVFDSMVLLIIGVMICYFFARDDLAVFVFATAVSLIISAIVFGIVVTVRRSKAEKKRAEGNVKDK